MAEYVTTYPTAHKRHRCCVCGWDVMPGDSSTPWSYSSYPDARQWRYPDGERIPLPLQPRCVACGRLLDFWGLWCDPCDRARIARLSEQLLGLMA